MHLKPLLLPLAMLVIVASCGPDDISPGNSRGVYSRVQWLEEEEKWYGHITYEYHQWHRYSEARTGCISGHVSSTGDERRSATIGISGEEVTYLASMNESYKRVSYRNDCLPPECSETEVTTRNLLGSGTTDVLFGVHVEDGVGSFNVEPQGEIGALITGETEYSNCLGSRTSHIEGSLDLGVIVSGKGNVEPGSKPGTVVFQGERAQNGVFLGAEHPEWTETTKWYLTNNPEELIVEVEVVDYDDWRPEGSLIAEIAGNHIEVKATLRRADGGPPKELAQSFTFELAEVSNIPGVAMNYPPPPSPQNEPDLKFDPGTNPDMTLNAPTYSTAKTPEGERDSASVAVGAYDWGAHGIILVTAQLKSGRRIVGWLKGTTENRIRLPKRGRSSFIADVWKQDEAVESQPDDFDEEGIADLEGHTGDGLTLFEEYRGFIIDGRWVS
ncbi:hypothetical protein, partial [Archangium sp.]|uniref:hypothetical protein n=1 Tax=Archangium sp. TaxID=1872627 RepID=UPI002EDAC07D